MADIINLSRLRAWIRLKHFVESGRVVMPQVELPKPPSPQSDMADALLYALKCKGD